MVAQGVLNFPFVLGLLFVAAVLGRGRALPSLSLNSFVRVKESEQGGFDGGSAIQNPLNRGVYR